MRVAVTWEMCGYVDVPGKTMEEALGYLKNNLDHIKLPSNGEYVDGSFDASTWDVEEQEAITNFGSSTKEEEKRTPIRTIRLDDNREMRVYKNAAFVYYHKTGCESFITCRANGQSTENFIKTATELERHWHSIGWM